MAASSGSIMCQLMSFEGVELTSPMLTDLTAGPSELQSMYDSLGLSRRGPVRFLIENFGPLLGTLGESVGSAEQSIRITCVPESSGFVRPVCRCTCSLAGHDQVILVIKFSADNCFLATGSGDSTVRIWDTQTETPLKTLSGYHSDWVLDLMWSPVSDSQLVSSGRDGAVVVYSNLIANNGAETFARRLKKHSGYVGCVRWSSDGLRLASGSKDSTIRIWNSRTGVCDRVLNGHTQAVTGIEWTRNYLYSCSQDRTIRAWNLGGDDSLSYICVSVHAHWVNSIDVLNSGSVDLVAGGSDDHTVSLWKSNQKPKSCLRLKGHCQPVIHVRFSPDGRFLASASFDRTVRVWDSNQGQHLITLSGHVGRVYRIVWSPDSRYIVSASADSTVKLWNVKTKSLSVDLPGHEDEVYSLAWSSDGVKVATGGKDRMLKMWRR